MVESLNNLAEEKIGMRVTIVKKMNNFLSRTNEVIHHRGERMKFARSLETSIAMSSVILNLSEVARPALNGFKCSKIFFL